METFDSLFVELDSIDRHLGRRKFLKIVVFAAAPLRLAVGARRVFLPMLRPPKIERESDLKQIERLKFGYDDLSLYSDHTSGGNPYGKDAQRGVVDARGRVFGSENVYVADSSLFPTASGINPSWTIMALSHRMSLQLGESLK